MKHEIDPESLSVLIMMKQRAIYRDMCADLTEALQWALDQIEDDLDPDHQAALAHARATLNKAKGE